MNDIQNGDKMKIKQFRLILNLLIGTFSLLICLIVSVYILSFLLGPPPITGEQNTVYLDHTGEIIGEGIGSENRNWIKLDQMSPHVVEAMLAIEDKKFYDHNGFDIKGIVRAGWANIKSMSLKEGASTITQQYARNLFLSHEKTWARKIKEAFYAVRLEMYYSKDEILEGYLNMIYFGHGIYGIEAASRYFFDKNAHDLTLAEATMLVAIPKGPAYYSPLNNIDNNKDRQKLILTGLLEGGKISEESFSQALNEKLTFQSQKTRTKQNFGPHFLDTVLQEVQNILQLDREAVQSGGYQIYTTLNRNKQEQLTNQIDQQIAKESDIEIAAIAMNPHTGAIEGLIGGRNYEESFFNRAISAKRMPGSTFKPFLYYAALENNYTASTTLTSKPTSFVLNNDEVYKPSNFNGYYANEPITLAQAIALSDNVYAVKTNLFLGTDVLKKTAQRFGIKSDLPSVPSLALGTASVSVKEMVTAYGVLANGGREINAHTVHKIVDRHGNIIYEQENKPGKQVLDENKAFILTHMLTGMFDDNLNGYMEVTGSSIADKLTRLYAGKSGSTRYDSWMIGYSPSLVTGIWTGFDDNRAIEVVNDRSYAKNIWADFMEAAHKQESNENFSVPSGVVSVPIDPETGLVSTPYCPTSHQMYFIKGTEPKNHCKIHFPNDDNQMDPQKDQKKRGIFQRLFDLFM